MRKILPVVLILAFCRCGHEPDPRPGDKPLPLFSIESTQVETGAGASSVRIGIEAECNWSISSPSRPEWLEIVKSASAVSLIFQKNEDVHDRKYSFVITPSDSRLAEVMISVLQSGPVANADCNMAICALAERHLSAPAKAKLGILFPNGLSSIAPNLERFMQIDKYRAYTPNLRRLSMNFEYFYDPNYTQADGGDCVRGLRFADYYLSHLGRFTLPDEELYFYHSLLVVMLEDLHDPSLPALMPEGKHRTFEENPLSNLSWDGIIRKLDIWTEDEAAEHCKTSFSQWAQEICSPDVNPEDAIRKAGYRLAGFFNKYYGQ